MVPSERHGPMQMTTIEQKATEILDKGYRWLIADNYEQRMDFFAQELQNLDPSERTQLMDELLNQDDGAFMSWLKVDRLNALVDQGSITAEERDTIFDSFGQAYVEGKLDFVQALEFTNLFGSTAVGPLGLSPDGSAVQSLLGTLTNSNSPYSTAFIEKFATDVLQQRVYADPPALLPKEQGNYAGLLVTALEQSGGEASVAKVLQSLDASQRGALYTGLAQEGRSFTAEIRKDLGLSDPMVVAISAISHHGTTADKIELVKNVASNSRGDDSPYYDYENKPYQERSKALTELLTNDPKAILDELTVADPTLVAGSTNGTNVTGQNLAALSNLVRMTALNSDNPDHAKAMQALTDYAAGNVATGNKIAGQDDVNGDGKLDELDKKAIDAGNGRVAMLAAVMQDAVEEGYVDLKNDQEAQKAMLGFVLDVVVSAIPIAGEALAGPLSKQISGGLLARFPDLTQGQADAIAKKLASIPAGQLTDLQGNLTDTAKNAILEALPEDLQYLEEVKNSSNGFTKGLMDSTASGYNIIANVEDFHSYINTAQGQ
jgi:hypothetical protein